MIPEFYPIIIECAVRGYSMVNDSPNRQPGVETLGQYVKRILDEKQLTMTDVEERSENGIADAYVANIVKGVAKNPSVDKLKALAVGLGEPEDDVFKVARGLPLDYVEEGGRDPWPGTVLAKAIDKIVTSPELTKILQALMQMSLKELKAVLKYIESRKKSKGNKKG
jgi:transcriptional regulator with XRE-family HTH domain